MQAAILTGRRSKTGISVAEIDDSVDRIVAGMEGTPMVDSKSKSLVAYHEVGHAVCGTLTPGTLSTRIAEAVVRLLARPLDTWCCAIVAYNFKHSPPCSASTACFQQCSAMLATASLLLICGRTAVLHMLCCPDAPAYGAFAAAGISSPTSIIFRVLAVYHKVSRLRLLPNHLKLLHLRLLASCR